MGLLFEWNSRKAAQNLSKHGVSFEEDKDVFGDPEELMISDLEHSEDEERLISIGLTSAKRLLVVCYTETDAAIRVISAREAEQNEATLYWRH